MPTPSRKIFPYGNIAEQQLGLIGIFLGCRVRPNRNFTTNVAEGKTRRHVCSCNIFAIDRQAYAKDRQAYAKDRQASAKDGQTLIKDRQASAMDGLTLLKDGQASAMDGQALL
jgi:hypothetical protein